MILSGKVYDSGYVCDVNIEITDPGVIALFEQGKLNYFSIEKDAKLVKDFDVSR